MKAHDGVFRLSDITLDKRDLIMKAKSYRTVFPGHDVPKPISILNCIGATLLKPFRHRQRLRTVRSGVTY